MTMVNDVSTGQGQIYEIIHKYHIVSIGSSSENAYFMHTMSVGMMNIDDEKCTVTKIV